MSRESFIAIYRLCLFTTTNVTFLKALGAKPTNKAKEFL